MRWRGFFGAGPMALAAGAQGAGGGGGPPPGTFDYVIASDADWATIPAPLLSGGGSIGVTPGVAYTTKTLTMRPSAELTFDTTVPGQMPRIPNLILQDCANLGFGDLEFVTAAWPRGDAPAVAWKSATAGPGIGGIRFFAGATRGNYRGNVDFNFDPAKNDYPEYASIIPQFAADGTLASLIIINATVGDLLADGTYTLDFSNAASGNGITFSTFPTATMTVAGGIITGTTITGVGASSATTTINTSTGILSKVITWAGQQRMIDYLAYGHQAISGSGFKSVGIVPGAVMFGDHRMSLLFNGFKSNVGSRIEFTGTEFDLIYGDTVAFGLENQDPEVIMRWVRSTRPFSKTGDPGDPHSDLGMQMFMTKTGGNTTLASLRKVICYGNVVDIGAARGNGQVFFFADPPATGNVGYGGMIAGNIAMIRLQNNSVSLESADAAAAWYNTVLHNFPAENDGGVATIGLGSASGGKVYGDSVAGRNIAEAIGAGSAGGGTVERNRFPNLALGSSGSALSYMTVMPGFNGPKGTVAEIVAAVTPAAGYAEYGAVQPGFVDFVNRTINWAIIPHYVRFAPLTGQATGASVNSPWQRVSGPPGSVNFNVTNGQLQVANDASGSGATAAASSGGFTTTGYAEKFIRVTGHTTSGAGSTATISTVTLNGTAYTWPVVTQIVTSFATIDNQATARSTFAQPASSITGLSKMVLGVRWKADVNANNANILSNASASTFRLFTQTSGSAELRATFISSSVGLMRHLWTHDTNWHTTLIALDFTKTVATDVARMVVDHNLLPHATGAAIDVAGNRTFTTANLFSTTGCGVFCETDGGGVLFDGRMEWLWCQFFPTADAMPDITDPFVQAAFSADRFASDGSVSGLLAQPHYFYAMEPTGANASSLANAGTVASAPLVKAAGTYV